jgi:hypothetical protein
VCGTRPPVARSLFVMPTPRVCIFMDYQLKGVWDARKRWNRRWKKGPDSQVPEEARQGQMEQAVIEWPYSHVGAYLQAQRPLVKHTSHLERPLIIRL